MRSSYRTSCWPGIGETKSTLLRNHITEPTELTVSENHYVDNLSPRRLAAADSAGTRGDVNLQPPPPPPASWLYLKCKSRRGLRSFFLGAVAQGTLTAAIAWTFMRPYPPLHPTKLVVRTSSAHLKPYVLPETWHQRREDTQKEGRGGARARTALVGRVSPVAARLPCGGEVPQNRPPGRAVWEERGGGLVRNPTPPQSLGRRGEGSWGGGIRIESNKKHPYPLNPKMWIPRLYIYVVCLRTPGEGTLWWGGGFLNGAPPGSPSR